MQNNVTESTSVVEYNGSDEMVLILTTQTSWVCEARHLLGAASPGAEVPLVVWRGE
jgi:hypothetical protein